MIGSRYCFAAGCEESLNLQVAPANFDHNLPRMSPDGLLRAFVVPGTLVLAWQAWTTRTTGTSSYFFVSATLEQCHLDCAGNTTADLMADAALNGRPWSVWDTQRLVGPTEPASELNATYPYARAPFPLPFTKFCQLGCSYFFAGSPRNTTCAGLCDDFYARNVSVGINDYAEKVIRRGIDWFAPALALGILNIYRY